MTEENKSKVSLSQPENDSFFSSKSFKALMIALIALIILLFPLPYYIEMPGTTEKLTDMVQVEGKKDTEEGGFYLTTVSVGKANIAGLIRAHFSSFADVYSQEELMGDSTNEDYNRMNQFYMENAQNTAIYKAFDLAKQKYEFEYKGVYVLDVSDKSSFKDTLHVADTLTKVDGKNFKSSKELMDYVGGKKVGDKVDITFLDTGLEKNAQGKIIKIDNGKNGIGISLVDHTTVKTDPKVEINAGAIGGPSAGLMFTLEIYEQITGKNLRNGREIAGTGTIATDGTVGRIGGIDKKIATASKSGAEIFFAPDDEITDEMKKADPDIKTNYQEAVEAGKKLKTDMKIVPVKNVNDALKYLEE